jgi:hypothetical protein
MSPNERRQGRPIGTYVSLDGRSGLRHRGQGQCEEAMIRAASVDACLDLNSYRM